MSSDGRSGDAVGQSVEGVSSAAGDDADVGEGEVEGDVVAGAVVQAATRTVRTIPRCGLRRADIDSLAISGRVGDVLAMMTRRGGRR